MTLESYRILLGPDPSELSGGTVATTPDVSPTNGGPEREDLSTATVSDSGDTSTTDLGAATTPADPNNAAGATPPKATEPQWQSILDAAKAQGFQFAPDIQDDRAALNYLLKQAEANKQADYYAQLGRQLQPHAQGIQQYLKSQTQPAQPTRQPWEAPEFDRRWIGLVEHDPVSGLYVGKPGVPAEIVAKVNQYAEWKANYDQDPASVINGMVEARAKSIAAETFREQFAAQQRETEINRIIQENAPWLYQVDASGQKVVNYNGQLSPTPVGARYLHHLEAVQRAGVRDPRQQDALAKQLVRGEYALSYQQQQAAAAAQANPQTKQAISQPNVNPLQALPPNQRRLTPAATEPSATGKTLREMLAEELAAEGVTDADFAHLVG